MKRRVRRKPGIAKRMMVTMLSLVMLLSVFSPGLMASADDTGVDPTVQQTPETSIDQTTIESNQEQLTQPLATENQGNFMDSFIDAFDQQTQSGTETLGYLALSYIAKYDVLKTRIQALDAAAEDYAVQVEALNAEIAALAAAVAASVANGELNETEAAAVNAAAVGSASDAAAPAGTVVDESKLSKKTVTSYVNEMTFAVTGKLPEGVTLSVQKLDDALAAFIRSDVLGLGALPAGYTGAAYDIKLMKDGAEIQPAEAVTLGVTAKGITSKADVAVYHLPGTSADSVSAANGIDLHGLTGSKIEKVNCYDEGYYAFFTSGFSVYYVSTGNLNAPIEEKVELNEVATNYVVQYTALTARAKLLDPESETYAADQEALGLEAEVVDNAAIASYENGEFDKAQWNVITQASADFYAALLGEEPVEMEEASTLVDYTVTFSVGDAAAADVPTPSSVKVTGGKTISDLPEPVWKTADGQFVKVFAGWYSDEALTTEFTTETEVNADTTLHAKWVEPNAEGVYYVNFYSQDGQTVHLTLSAMAGKTVAPAQGPTLVDKVFKGWSTKMQGDSPAAALEAFNFDTPISEVATQGVNSKTLNLYAWYANSVNVTFIANGGTAVPTQTIAEGDTATKPETTREGYTFKGWSTDKDNYREYNFATPVNEDLILYAFWNADLVPVTIVYMYENPNDAEYSPAGTSAKVYAPAGSYVSIEKSTITAKGQTHAVRYADTKDGALTGYAKQSASTNSGNATIPDISGTYFQYETASNKRWVNPNGSTTILVYYNRARVTLAFKYDQEGTNASIAVNDLITEANRTKYAVSYTQNSTSKFTYSFTAKYGEDITAVWPQVGWVKDSSGNTPSSGNSSFYGWDKPDGQAQVTNMYTLEWNLFGKSQGDGLSVNNNGVLVGNGNLPAQFSNVYTLWAIYARATLPGETADFIYNGENYTIYTEACQKLMATGTLRYKKLDGCTAASDKIMRVGYGANMSLSDYGVTTPNSTLKDKFDEQFPKQIANDEYCQVLLYDRTTLVLSVWANDTTYGSSDPQQANYLYGDKIYNDEATETDADLLKTLEKNMTKAGYVFAGWFTTPEFTPGTEYIPDENSAITANINLYAKWEPNQFRAEYYLYVDDADPYAWQGFAEGGKIDDKLVPSAVQDSFLGWYWYQNGQLVPFDFTSAVGANHVDEDDVLKLYAKWSGTNGKVSYLPGIGGDNATQEVLDPLVYAINDASVQLKQYTNVWASGVPTNSSLTFVGWKAPNGVIYQPGRYVRVTRNLMQFEAQWSNDAVQLIYYANGGVGNNVTENWARNSVVSIWDNMDGTTPHFTREGYTLLGWDENPSATTPTYQLGQGSITLDKDVTTLYAIWKLNTVELTIQKTVSGNMYNPNEEFSFTLFYDGKSETFTLKGGDSKTFQVPVGAEVTVTEDLTNSNGYIPSNGAGTTVKLTNTSKKYGIFKFIMPEENGKLVINNDKTVPIDTGIELNSFPFIMMLSSCIVMAVFFFIGKKRMMF